MYTVPRVVCLWNGFHVIVRRDGFLGFFYNLTCVVLVLILCSTIFGLFGGFFVMLFVTDEPELFCVFESLSLMFFHYTSTLRVHHLLGPEVLFSFISFILLDSSWVDPPLILKFGFFRTLDRTFFEVTIFCEFSISYQWIKLLKPA